LKKIASENVLFLGKKPHQEIPYYLKAANLLILPNTSQLSYYKYTSPLKVFEYLASGTPILASSLGSIKEILNEKNAFLFDPKNKKKLVKKIKFIKENYYLCKEKTLFALKDACKFDWSERVQKILKFLVVNKFSSKIIVAMYRKLGIENGKGYQPVSIFSVLEKEGLLEKMYVYKITDDSFKNNKKIVEMPYLLWIAAHLSKGGYLHCKKFFDRFIEFKLKNKTNSNILFNYFPSVKFLKKLKSKNNKIFLFAGSLYPEYWLKVIQNECQKIGITEKNLVKELKENIEASKFLDGVIVMSRFSKNIWRKYLPKIPVYLAPLGIDTNFFTPGNKKSRMREKIFLYLGRISCTKGVHYLIKAWQLLNLKDAKLILGGGIKESEKNFFDKLISQTKNIEYKGYIPSVLEVYQKSLVFVFPSLTEGFGRVVLEAMSCGLPVITTPCAAHFVEDGKNGFVIPERNIDSLKEKILYFYRYPEEAIKMGQEARKVALNATWRNFEENFSKAIKCLIENENS